jgi:hypothetical protein
LLNDPDISQLIEAALLQGATRAVVEAELIRRAAANATNPPQPAEIDAAYAVILDRWIADAAQDEEKTFAYHVRMRKHLYQKSFSLNDFKTCLAIAADLAKLEEQHRDRQEKTADKKKADSRMGCA